jgi:alanine racemase
MDAPAFPSSARLRIDLGALVQNWREIARRAAPARTAAVVKANAYGLGLGPVAGALATAGCNEFFVAGLDEALALRAEQPRVTIYALGGVPPGAEPSFVSQAIVPVLNTPDEVRAWVRHAAHAPAAVQLDTGMTRSGLDARDVDALCADTATFPRLRLALVLSHFACADERGHPLNDAQLERFEALRARLPPASTSFANSAGVLLGPRYRGDVVRPGIALYGGNPSCDDGPSPMREVVRLQGRVLQLREVQEPGVTVGYGATWHVRPPARLATVGVGYADGYLRALGGKGIAIAAGRRVPVVGRVSMDLVTLDVTHVPPAELAVGDYVDLIGGGVPLDEVARLAGTLGYELLTRLSSRAERVYLR